MGKRATHQPQIESLAALMIEEGLVDSNTLLVELGAGKALLGKVVADLGQLMCHAHALSLCVCVLVFVTPPRRVVLCLLFPAPSQNNAGCRR